MYRVSFAIFSFLFTDDSYRESSFNFESYESFILRNISNCLDLHLQRLSTPMAATLHRQWFAIDIDSFKSHS